MANTDLHIARRATMLPIAAVADKAQIPADAIEPYGGHKAKIDPAGCAVEGRPPGKLVLVSAITPTPAGEGKTTTTIGLADALNRIGRRAMVCIREPSLGPCFGMKGGAAGGGYAQVVPMEDINLHFTGDFHAIGVANNLLAAAIDNHLHHGNTLQLDPRRIIWRRALDVNDRALRDITIGLGGPGNSLPRQDGFDITSASEIMAILCLSESLGELKQRIGRIVVGLTAQREPVCAADLNVHGAMTVLLKDALKPNLVQTLEHTPALVHGGPFANIAHGCNSLIATRLAMRLSEYTVTEAGFGADLGAEKFLNIKCRQAGIAPNVVVLVATLRALKVHGGVPLADISQPDAAAVERGVENLRKHIENIHKFHLPTVVAINRFSGDTEEELQCVHDKCDYLGVQVITADHWARGGAGAEALAESVVELAERHTTDFKLLYRDEDSLWSKTRAIAREIYGADDILGDKRLRDKFRQIESQGYGHLPICMAKTQYSLSTDPLLKGRPSSFDVPVRDVRLAAGAGFVIVLTGDIMRMPGLPRIPAAEAIDVDENGEIVGLF